MHRLEQMPARRCHSSQGCCGGSRHCPHHLASCCDGARGERGEQPPGARIEKPPGAVASPPVRPYWRCTAGLDTPITHRGCPRNDRPVRGPVRPLGGCRASWRSRLATDNMPPRRRPSGRGGETDATAPSSGYTTRARLVDRELPGMSGRPPSHSTSGDQLAGVFKGSSRDAGLESCGSEGSRSEARRLAPAAELPDPRLRLGDVAREWRAQHSNVNSAREKGVRQTFFSSGGRQRKIAAL
jgi:hypothetical protein